jgi:hypothetical protein
LESAIAAAAAVGLVPVDLMPSPIQGQKGNREFLLYAQKGGAAGPISVEEVVREAWKDESP